MSSHAQENIKGSLNKNKVFVGDVISFIVKAQLPHDAQIKAEQHFSFNDFDIISSSVKHISSAENIYELNFNIAAYKTGRLTINPIKVFYINPDGDDNSFFTPQAEVEVASIVGNSPPRDIQDIKSLKKLNIKPIYIVLIIFTLLSFAAYIAVAVKDFKNRKKESKQADIDPKAEALNVLDDLYQNRRNISTRIFYYRMSEILRTYVSKRHGFDAMEMTTSEFFSKMKTFLPQEININEFKNYLKIFNLARYAGFNPNDTEIENNYNFTKKLLELL
jgi:hypothetical protein